MPKFRKKPVEIEAILLEPTQRSIRQVLGFKGTPALTNCRKAIDAFESYCEHRIEDGGLNIETLEGTMKASFGDYIVKGIKGEFYPCKPDIFKLTYDAVEK
tara:strand:- start:49 stop:351 length:303 start_codon:yes stop_codon:yes gene_type:complete